MQAMVLASFLSVPLFGIAASYGRDDMPPPSRAPRTPVTSEKIPVIEVPNEVAGGAMAVDGQTLRLREGNRDMNIRLAGVVAPPVTSSEGLAARAALDSIVSNQTLNCSRQDRDGEGRAIMNCTYNGGKNVAEELLFTGSVLYSRAASLPAELAVRFKAAEETAQSRRIGLWKQVASINVGATQSANTASSVRPAATAATAAATTAANPAVAAKATPVAVQPIVTPTAETVTVVENTTSTSRTTLWLEAMGLLGVLFGMLAWLDNRHTRRERLRHDLEVSSERQVLAAALSGELSAARDICEARAAQIVSGRGKPTWPRLRTYVYQSHVEHIGLLGSVLARQVASIYGQMADYAASHREESETASAAAMARTLARLCGYIEIALEGLADVEQTGDAYYPIGGMLGATEASEKHAAQVARKVTQKLPTTAVAAKPQPLPAATKKITATTPAPVEAPEAPTADADMLDNFAAPKETRVEAPAEKKVEAKPEAKAPVAESPADKTDITAEDKAPVAEQPAASKIETPAATTPAAPSGQIPWWKQRQLQKAADAAKKPEAVGDTTATATTARTPLASRLAERQKAISALREETAKLEALDTGIVAPDVPMGATA